MSLESEFVYAALDVNGLKGINDTLRYKKHNVSRETYKRSSEKSGLLFCSERSGSGVDYECGIIK